MPRSVELLTVDGVVIAGEGRLGKVVEPRQDCTSRAHPCSPGEYRLFCEFECDGVELRCS